MSLPHYRYQPEKYGLIFLKKLKLIKHSYGMSISDILDQVKQYEISSNDLYSIDSVKYKLREYNLDIILKNI